MPVVAVGDAGTYRIRGIHIDDLARLCADLGEGVDDVVVDAVGPETLTFAELLDCIRSAVGSRARVVSVPGWSLVAMTAVLGVALRDRLLTGDEYRAMAGGLATSDGPSTGRIALTEWMSAHADELGRSYANEISRHFAPAVRAGASKGSR
jgi:uncharacterized protein YbjT (DUF2867 family)